MLPDEIELVQAAARFERVTMSDFIRESSVQRARQVLQDAGESLESTAA